jgi:UDP-glucose 4-epimerase
VRVLVTGASGNVGTSLLETLGAAPEVDSILALARRVPDVPPPPKTEWAAADLTLDPIAPLLDGVDAVVHLAWAIQPARDRVATRRTNVGGSARLFEALAEAGTRSLLYASSIGAYSPRTDDGPVDESWPTGGIESSFYSRDKAAVERMLRRFIAENPRTRVAWMRPALIFKGASATEIRRYFAGPFVPGSLLRPGRLPLLPWVSGLRLQAVHADDVAEAFRLALLGAAEGPFNLAAEPVLGAAEVAEVLGARRGPDLPAGLVRALADASFRVRLQPTPPGWLDMGLGVPLIDSARARSELGWEPSHSASETLRELLEALAAGEGGATPPLDPARSGPGRIRELLGGVGGRNPP